MNASTYRYTVLPNSPITIDGVELTEAQFETYSELAFDDYLVEQGNTGEELRAAAYLETLRK